MKNPLETLSEPRIGCVQHDCDNCKTHRDILVRHLAEIERLRGENEALKADAERWKFTLWWQDQNPRPEHIQACLTNMHRWARKRGALGPNSEELQLAVDHAMAARSK